MYTVSQISHCNLKKDYQTLIIFDMNIPDTAGHHITVPTPNVLFSPGRAEADDGWGENLNGHMVASCVWNIRTKSY